MASANTSAKKYAAGTMDEMDISSMFHKLGNKLGWHEHGDLDTAIQTLSAKAKRHKSKLKLSSEKKTPVAKKENKNPTSKMSDCRNVLPLAEELGDVMKPLANFDSNNCLERTPTSTGSLSERRRGKLSRKKGKLRTKTDTPTNVENHHTFAFPAPVSRNSGAHSKTKTNRSRRIVDCSSTGSDPEFQSSSTQEDGGGSDANGEGGGGDDDGFYEDSIFIHGDGDPDDDGGIKELPPDVSAYFSTTVVAGDGFAEAASSDGGNRGDYGGTYADLLAAEDRFSHVTVRSRGPRCSRSILDEWDDVPVSESTVLYTGASPGAGHAQNLARDVTPAATGVADSAGMREVSPSVNKRSTSEDTKTKELERGKNIFAEPPSFTKKATAVPKSTGGSSLADSRVAGAVDGNFGGNWERFDRKVESWGKLKRGSSLYFTCLDESVFIPDLATRLRVKEAADNRKPPTKEAARKNIFQSLTDLLREEKTIGDPGAPSKVDSDSPETTNASKTSVAEVVNLVDSSDDDDPGNSPRLIDEHVSPWPVDRLPSLSSGDELPDLSPLPGPTWSETETRRRKHVPVPSSDRADSSQQDAAPGVAASTDPSGGDELPDLPPLPGHTGSETEKRWRKHVPVPSSDCTDSSQRGAAPGVAATTDPSGGDELPDLPPLPGHTGSETETRWRKHVPVPSSDRVDSSQRGAAPGVAASTDPSGGDELPDLSPPPRHTGSETETRWRKHVPVPSSDRADSSQRGAAPGVAATTDPSGRVPRSGGALLKSDSSSESEFDGFLARLRTPKKTTMATDSTRKQREADCRFIHDSSSDDDDYPSLATRILPRPTDGSSGSIAQLPRSDGTTDGRTRGGVSPRLRPGQRGGVSRPRPGRGGGGASVKSRAVPPTIVTRADPAYAPRLDFLASLSAHVPAGRQRHVEAARYVLEFRHRRDALVRQLFALYNARAFDGRLPADLAVTWNARMTKTAGFCYNRVDHAAPRYGRSARIELSTKVCDSAERTRDTLAHELCHAAAWVISGSRDGHGPLWRQWTALTCVRLPGLPPIGRTHTYVIETKYVYRCTRCDSQVGRHSKSLDITKKVCGLCKGRFQLLVRGKPAQGGVQQPQKPLGGFALFVKDNYGTVKQRANGAQHADVMRLLSAEFAAKNTISDA